MGNFYTNKCLGDCQWEEAESNQVSLVCVANSSCNGWCKATIWTRRRLQKSLQMLRSAHELYIDVQSEPFSIQIEPSWRGGFQEVCVTLKCKVKSSSSCDLHLRWMKIRVEGWSGSWWLTNPTNWDEQPRIFPLTQRTRQIYLRVFPRGSKNTDHWCLVPPCICEEKQTLNAPFNLHRVWRRFW